MREINSMSFLANLRPQFASERTVTAMAPENPDGVEGVDPGVLQQHLKAAEGLSTKEVLAQYDLRNINREDLTSLTTILHDRNEISDLQFNTLFAEGGLAFPDSNTEKGDFLGFLENKMQNMESTGNARQDGWIRDAITKAVTTAQSIDRAKSTDADHVVISNWV